jgi:hypothetical protein
MRWTETTSAKPPGVVTDTSATKRTFQELSRVTLSRPVPSEEGQVPAGSTGTVVHVWSSGTACEVEFTMPFRAIATVKADDIAARVQPVFRAPRMRPWKPTALKSSVVFMSDR